MKKILLGGIIVCFGVLMIGCGSTTDSETTTKDNEDEQKYSKPESKKDENYIKDGPLTKVNQWKNDDGEKIKLLKIITPNTLFDLDPIQMRILDIKLLEHYDLNADVKKEYQELTGKEQENYLSIQISLKTEDTDPNKEIMFHGIDTIITNTKQQIDVSNESWTSLDVMGVGTFKGNVEKTGYLVVPFYGKADELKNLTIISSKVWDDKEPTLYHDSEKKEFNF
ncbi:TPA: hypothetical protein RF372_000518 [Listeria monocytogenes]|uniref:Lin1232 protein n=1 Tax=Listeria innocua serovar 6a (strain ATCC BAA-680 / CLIP 11262) TaxID=272626 RepID=Q92CE0_LISIN|nr:MULTISPECIES: hypothetical protein [Listeria]EAE5608328.1 hypothetical protein [Listeria monocytogenes]EAE9977206.1 hypothetical protein [Listeria monocytogenes]EAE9987834.1 hypothetical protein [Listeria monocytogenes]EAE9989520.1 hypothetical protein [Listeria monocytogenes]EAE9992023.1 hypothetical protein [Listeria monocytogenes]